MDGAATTAEGPTSHHIELWEIESIKVPRVLPGWLM